MLNAEFGLKTVAGNANLYKKLLAKLVTQADGAIPEIQKALSSADQELAVRTAHSLKGASVSLGAEKLSEISAMLEQTLRNSDDPSDLLAELAVNIQKTKEAIAVYLA